MDLVVGVDGMLGSSLLKHLRRLGREAQGTSRRTSANREALPLDLAREASSWRLPAAVETAYICAGIAGLAACRENPAGTRRVNVDATAELCRLLTRRGAFVVFLSSSQVFNGAEPLVLAECRPSPLSEYGRQKAAAERALLESGEGPAAVVRLTKVLGPNDLLAGWARRLAAGKMVEPLQDLMFCPVPLKGVVTLLGLIGELKEPGLWQVSGEQDVTYAKAAQWGAQVLGASLELVRPTTTKEQGLKLEEAGPYSSLDGSRIEKSLGLALPIIQRTISIHFMNAAGGPIAPDPELGKGSV